MHSKNRSSTLVPSLGLSLPYFDEILNRPQMGVGSFVWCRQSNQVTLAANLWRMLGMKPLFEPIEGNLWRFIHESQQSRARRELVAATAEKHENLENLYRMRTSDDSILMCAMRAKIRYEGDDASRVEGIFIDVTSVPRLMMAMTVD